MITAANLLGAGSLTDGTVYNTASVSLKAGRLYLLLVQGRRSTNAAASAPTVTGASQTWTQVDTHQLSSATRFRTTLFRCVPVSDASGALTITFPETQSVAGWILDEFTGARGGNNGANAIIQSESDEGAAGTSYSDVLATFAYAENATYIAASVGGTATAITPEAGWTELSDFLQPTETGSAAMFSAYKPTPDTSPSFSWTTSIGVNGAICVEIAALTSRQATMHDLGVAVG